jgi:hypothetical protein
MKFGGYPCVITCVPTAGWVIRRGRANTFATFKTPLRNTHSLRLCVKLLIERHKTPPRETYLHRAPNNFASLKTARGPIHLPLGRVKPPRVTYTSAWHNTHVVCLVIHFGASGGVYASICSSRSVIDPLISSARLLNSLRKPSCTILSVSAFSAS